MSIYGAMFSGVSGLNANSQALGAIADNITNVNTIGYKSTEVRFQTLVTAQAGLNNYSPGGVQQRPFAAVDVQGLFQSSTNATDLGISGDGFFVVNENSQHDGATGFRFTRAGAFNADKSGFLRNTAGFYLQGYRTNISGETVDDNGDVFQPDPTVFTSLETIRLNNIGGTADATENLTFGANLNADLDVGDTSNTTIQVYDSLGVAHNLQMIWTKAANNQWDLSIAPPTDTASAVMTDDSNNVYASVGRLDFTSQPSDGQTIVVTLDGVATTYEFDSNAATTSGGTAVTIGASVATTVSNLVTALTAADTAQGIATARFSINADDTSRIDIAQTTTVAGDADATDIVFNASGTSVIRQSSAGAVTIDALDLLPSAFAAVSFDGSGIPTAFNVDQIHVDLNNGAADLDIDFNFGTVGQADGLVQFSAAYNPSFIDTDGAAFGQFSGVTISETGLVTALFENGDIRPIFKVPVATFPNPNGLGTNTGNVYNQTDNSGLFFLRTPGSGGAGTVQAAVLESSTVDIAKEFTSMITTQRAYSASAKIISTADEMLDELVRIKR
jgi:flagellar hook protein FlgE